MRLAQSRAIAIAVRRLKRYPKYLSATSSASKKLAKRASWSELSRDIRNIPIKLERDRAANTLKGLRPMDHLGGRSSMYDSVAGRIRRLDSQIEHSRKIGSLSENTLAKVTKLPRTMKRITSAPIRAAGSYGRAWKEVPGGMALLHGAGAIYGASVYSSIKKHRRKKVKSTTVKRTVARKS